MTQRRLTGLLMFLLFLATGCNRVGDRQVGGATELEQAEKAHLQGTWRVVAAGGDKTSKPASREQVEGMRMTYTFGPDTFQVKYDGVGAPTLLQGDYQFRVDPTRNPKWVDYKAVGSDEWKPGVYELQGETLKVRWANYGRPASVTDDSVGVSVLAVMERVK